MKINLEFDTENYINMTESNKLKQINSSLLGGYNGWKDILGLLNKIPLLEEKYDKEMKDMQEHGNCGISSCLCSVIEEAFYDLSCYLEDEEEQSDCKILENENYQLKCKIERLEKKLTDIKEMINL